MRYTLLSGALIAALLAVAPLPALPPVFLGAVDGGSVDAGSDAGFNGDGGFQDATNPEFLISSVPPLTVAPGDLGGKVLPPTRYLKITATELRVSASGLAGSTNVVFRVTDGTNTCDCAFACNISTGNKRVACSDNGGSGCLFPPSADLTYSWNSAGDCATPPSVVGNVDVSGDWQ